MLMMLLQQYKWIDLETSLYEVQVRAVMIYLLRVWRQPFSHDRGCSLLEIGSVRKLFLAHEPVSSTSDLLYFIQLVLSHRISTSSSSFL